ncbi:hypothetical protein K438DRAFT_863810 [Mycena galopus ATCC 62051]|nr:hypothetical protein K438DRAFT_863810 [Mycena galopus ATCC 62051]
MDLDLPQHPCYRNPSPSSRLKPGITSSLKYMKMVNNAVPANYPYALPPVEGLLYGHKASVHQYLPVPFFEFRGAGAPPADLGTPGDVYINLTPTAHALYCKAEEDWARWAPGAAAEQLLCHPHFVGCGNERYLSFHQEQGSEWVCRQTILRRQQALRAARILKSRDAASTKAGWDVAATVIEQYLARTAENETPATMDGYSSDIFASDSDAESAHSVGFYPSKRARALASSFLSATLAAKPQTPPSSQCRQRHPSPDPETQHLEEELTALQADQDLQGLRARKRELMTSFSPARGFRLAPQVLQTLETDYSKYRLSSPIASLCLTTSIQITPSHLMRQSSCSPVCERLSRKARELSSGRKWIARRRQSSWRSVRSCATRLDRRTTSRPASASRILNVLNSKRRSPSVQCLTIYKL